jgi:hypothetical protein
MKTVKPDYRFEYHGSLFLCRPLNKRAADWLFEHVEEAAGFLGDAVAVEPRYAQDLARNLTDDGFVVR